MSMSAKPNQLKLFVAAAGLLGLLLRLVLLETALDEKGLLVSGHWADVGVWLLTAAVIGMICLFAGGLTFFGYVAALCIGGDTAAAICRYCRAF
mgnify:CR=1 FL=1